MNIWEGDRKWVIALDHEVKSYERCGVVIFQRPPCESENLNEKENIQSFCSDVDIKGSSDVPLEDVYLPI